MGFKLAKTKLGKILYRTRNMNIESFLDGFNKYMRYGRDSTIITTVILGNLKHFGVVDFHTFITSAVLLAGLTSYVRFNEVCEEREIGKLLTKWY